MSLALISIGVFTGVILILVLILNFAESKLLPQGDVSIKINDNNKIITTRPGATLLSTLANENIFLPSACGGGGTCAMCRCQVLDGGGEILPTETGFINRKDAKDNWRLGCQVKIKENMDIHVPDE
ncbi:MAG: 2Fe-2S iron-sulfur cluster-binding protein, partial [Candidatus Marinimicrobia bacterium]|nr:2Fe-2S iron-sulfur cluster-binding protein [Candidatus Neomarinimicrobiota bacterium]